MNFPCLSFSSACFLEGSGSFGKIYYAINSQNGQEVAVKTEDHSGAWVYFVCLVGIPGFSRFTICYDKNWMNCCQGRHPMLLYEAKLLKHLEGGQGIAHVYYSGSEGLVQSWFGSGNLVVRSEKVKMNVVLLRFYVSILACCPLRTRWLQCYGDGSPGSIIGGSL